jgi:hypothetical protein
VSASALEYIGWKLDPGSTSCVTFAAAAEVLGEVGVHAEATQGCGLLELVERGCVTIVGVDGATLYGSGRPRPHAVLLASCPRLEGAAMTIEFVDPSPRVHPLQCTSMRALEEAYRATNSQALVIRL